MIYPNSTTKAEEVAAHYNDLDEYYRELWGEHVHHGLWTTGRETADEAVVQLTDFIAKAARIGEGDSVCDVGCGYGGTARRLVTEFKANVTAMTISQAQYDYAVEISGGATNPQFLLRNWLANLLPADSFDAVVSIECVSHLEDKQAYFDEIARVLKPGGRAAIAVWLTSDAPKQWHIKHLLEPICREGRLPSMGSVPEYNEMITQAGLEIDDFQDISRQVRKTWWICGWRLSYAVLTQSRYRQELWSRNNRNWIFAVTLWRILMAYYTGAMRYGLYTLAKPSTAEPAQPKPELR